MSKSKLSGSALRASQPRKTKRASKSQIAACKHRRSMSVWTSALAAARICADCGELLSLGPSNDEPAEVQTEIRAAELSAMAGSIESRPGKCPGIAQLGETWGWADHGEGSDYEEGIDGEPDAWWSGWLAREIVVESERTDPVTKFGEPAQQVTVPVLSGVTLSETRRILGLKPADPDEIAAIEHRIAEQTRHDVAASVARHAEIEASRPLVDATAVRAAVRAILSATDHPAHLTDDGWQPGPAPILATSEAAQEFVDRFLENQQAEQGVEVEIVTDPMDLDRDELRKHDFEGIGDEL